MTDRPLESPALLLTGRGINQDIVRRVERALVGVPDVQVISDFRAVRDQLKQIVASLQSEEQAMQDRIIARLQEYADKIDHARRHAPDKVDALIENAPDGLGVHEIDDQKVVRRVSPSEVRLLGYRSKSDIVGRPVWKFVVMQETAQRSIDKKISGSVDLKPFVRTYARADGAPIRLVIVDRIIHDGGGAITGICSILAESALSSG